MRTSATISLISLLLFSSPAWATEVRAGAPLTLGVPLEVDVVGLAYGIHPEVVWYPFPTSGAGFRAAFGLLPGPEYFYWPVEVGYRHEWFRRGDLRPHVGAGFQQQSFLVDGDEIFSRPMVYGEFGARLRVWTDGWVGLQLSPEAGFWTRPGFSLASRVTLQWDFDGE